MSHTPTCIFTHLCTVWVSVSHTPTCILTHLCTVWASVQHAYSPTSALCGPLSNMHTHPPLHTVVFYVPLIPIEHELRRHVVGVVQVDRPLVVRPRAEDQVTSLLVVRKPVAEKYTHSRLLLTICQDIQKHWNLNLIGSVNIVRMSLQKQNQTRGIGTPPRFWWYCIIT